MNHTFQLDEGDRQMIILALAELALTRPGWDWTIRETVTKLGGENASRMFAGFKETSADQVIFRQTLLDALQESLKLQAHYAVLLNAHDGGERRTFSTVKEWLARLAEVTPVTDEQKASKLGRREL